MSKEKRRVPKLRFPGFTEDWEQRKLSDVADVRDGTHDSPKFYNDGFPLVTSKNLKDGSIDFSDCSFISEQDFNEINKRSKVDPGDILFGMIGTIGKPAIVEHTGFAIKNVALIKEGDIINNRFIYHLLSSKVFDDYIARENAGGTQKFIALNQIRNFIFSAPTLAEQNKIIELLDYISQTITLHQRKLEHLNLKKKALLQKLFPKNGERYPELRFPGFTDAWEQRKLTDIAKTFIGLVTTMTENYRDSGTLLIRNSDIKEGQFIFSEKPIHLDEEFAEKNKTRRLHIGDVVTVHTGDIGTSAVIKEKEAGAIGFATINTRTDKRILNPYFLSTYFNTDKHKCYANSVSTGDGRSNYNIKDFNKLVISIPTLDEQEKISALINNINTIITLHQRKLEHLKLQKKALLQQLFV